MKIPKNWFEVLLKYAQRTDELSTGNYEIRTDYHLTELLGYISSAKTILKLYDDRKIELLTEGKQALKENFPDDEIEITD